MDKNTDDNGLSGIEELDALTQNAVLALGRVIHNAAIYGISHRATTEMLSEAYELSEAIVNSSGRMNFALRSNCLLVGGKLPDNSNPLIKQLYRKMKSKDITAFSIVKGMSLDEFKQLVEVLGGSDKRSFAEQLKSRSIKHVTSEKVVLQEVRDGEGVGGGSGKGRGSGSSSDIRNLAEEWLAENTGIVDGAASEGPGSGSGGGTGGAGVEQIVAFLKGDIASDDPQVQAELEKVANDSEKLAELIMEASTIRQSQSNIQSGESVADLVIGCLRRTFEGLRKAEKSAGKSNIELKKSFMLLEKNIIDKLHRVMGSSDESLDDEIRAAIAEMEDDVELGEIASEYMEQRALLARNQKRIAEYVRGNKGEKLQEKMMAAGMAPESWKSLVAKSASGEGRRGRGDGGESLGGAAESFGALAVVLAKFDDLMSSATPKADEVAKFIDHIEGHVDDVEQNTHEKIDKLNEDMQREIGLGNAEQRQIRKHRAQFSIFVERLAELAQELMQPLTVINCSINMSVSGQLGEISEEQKELLSLAQSNTNRLNRLIEHLTKLVGYPKDLTPKTVEGDEVEILPVKEEQ